MQKRAANSCPIWNMLKESDLKSHRPTPNSQLYDIFDIAACGSSYIQSLCLCFVSNPTHHQINPLFL